MVLHATEQSLTWRALLGQVIAAQASRRRIAELAGISELTLQRWAEGGPHHRPVHPRPANLQALLDVLPAHREALLPLIQVEYPAFNYAGWPEPVAHQGAVGDAPDKSIPLDLYERVVNTFATSQPGRLFWEICSLVLLQALLQLDPDQRGMQITVAKCMPPVRGGKVRCLWELVEVGTPPWRGDLAPTTRFLGAESLAGYAVASCSPAIVQRLGENPASLPVRKVEHGASAASFPLLRAGSIAGSMTLTSVEPDYFTPPRLSLIGSSCRLLMLGFQNEALYERSAIELSIMPPDAVQQALLSTFRQRVNALLIDDARGSGALTMGQAEQCIREQIIEELLQPALRPG